MRQKQRRGKPARSLNVKFSRPIPAILMMPAEEPKIRWSGEGLLAKPVFTEQAIKEWHERRYRMVADRLEAACKLFDLSLDDLRTNGANAVGVIFAQLFPGFSLLPLGSLASAKPAR